MSDMYEGHPSSDLLEIDSTESFSLADEPKVDVLLFRSSRSENLARAVAECMNPIIVGSTARASSKYCVRCRVYGVITAAVVATVAAAVAIIGCSAV